ncbi:hypothetical protein P691DRAFT_767953 [Macrolepiota fuliginosa MF-IS2]|uniref:Uncharacterized protein n=1 Tax=Macrolepiota fuliginosa MF-IS2 TaxID=1400762 RepID=A0A9P6BW08_9AGAR|nr:hypothetical protein P691DRAFT_767953 [Macrolepiota fuliginosa MF-IS2]
MPHKAKTKPASNAPMAFKPSSNMECFLTLMNQNCRLASQFTAMELMSITQVKWEQVLQDLLAMKFIKVDKAIPTNMTDAAPNEEDDIKYSETEISPAEDLTNCIACFRKWFKSNNIPDNTQKALTDNIRWLTMMFSLIPAPHCCPTPLPCICPHQADAPPCNHLHVDDISTPPPCVQPHHNDEDIPMELATPTHAFSEAASQTPAPSHKASTPPPPPAAAATLPAVAASNPPAGPHGHAPYAGTVARNLNPAAPPFMRGLPCAPVAQPPAQAQQPVSSKCLKQPFFVTRGPSCHQFFIKVPAIPSDTSLSTMVITANRTLMWAKSTLKVDSACLSPHGITCATATVPSTLDLDIIEATLSGRLTGAHVSIPASRSFIKIVDVPFFKSGTMDPFSSTEVDAQLQHSIIPLDFIVHWCYV